MTSTVHVAVYDTLSDWELGYVTAHINKPDWQKRPGRYRTATVGVTRDPVTTMGGLRITPELAVDEIDPADSAMLIMAGLEPSARAAAKPFVDLARRFLDAGKPVAAICGATLELAAGGLLDDRAHTSNAPEFLTFAPAYAGAEHYVDAPAVTDRGLITASGIHPADFARHIFAELDLYDEDTATAWYELYGERRPEAFFKLMAS
ncbi:DJ-1/PfpI family protein [Fodinicola acaciae]|uniref:DJ-1/PfpI family protein n=1 Tax=Fodinicola acaciae TaxID=2681555 RepID=UPI0013D6D822|nr:DJ-1/PfpI family protein [Fodinicola acaciae]